MPGSTYIENTLRTFLYASPVYPILKNKIVERILTIYTYYVNGFYRFNSIGYQMTIMGHITLDELQPISWLARQACIEPT